MDKLAISIAINDLRGKTPQEAYEILNFNPNLSQPEKSIAYTLGTFQPQILQDGDLMREIQRYRTNTLGNQRGSLGEDLIEISYIIKAYLSPQYRRFIKHLMISYLDDSQVFPVEGKFSEECGICHKQIHQFSRWVQLCEANPGFGEQYRKEYLSLGSSNSKTPICMNCLIQLRGAYDLLNFLDPGFLYKK